jgi:hypothetical protein
VTPLSLILTALASTPLEAREPPNAAAPDRSVPGSTVSGSTVSGSTVSGSTVSGSTVQGGTVSGEIAPAAGVLVSGFRYEGGSVAHTWLTAGANGRVRLALEGAALDALVMDLGAFGLVPVGEPGPAGGVTSVLRVGLEKGAWRVSAGIHGRVDITPAPLLVLPSLEVAWRPGDWGVSLDVMDRPYGPVVRLSVEHRYFGIGYAGLAGLEAWGRLPLGREVSLELRGFGAQLLPGSTGGGTVPVQVGGSIGLVWKFGVGSPGGGS